MKKNILVLGGSYFVGRVFSILAARSDLYNLHVVNRGTYKLNTNNTTQYVCDRHEPEKLASLLPELRWDAVVDFCAYERNDIASILAELKGEIAQYIYISTSSVYEPSGPSPKTEESALLRDPGCCGGSCTGDKEQEYAQNKLALEHEAASACARRNIGLTIIRPAFIYGPFNYAPREPFYFQLILEGRPIPMPTDACGCFQFVHVKDVAKILMGCIGNEKTYGGIYNASAPEWMNYESYFQALEKAHGSPLPREPYTVEQIYAQNIPLPFPLDCDELFTGDKIAKLLDMEYIPFEEGLAETYQVYMRAMQKG